MNVRLAAVLLAATQLTAIGSAGSAVAAEDQYAAAMAEISQKYDVNIKGIFAGNCSWCHDGYGMHGGKGPKLAGTNKTIEQLVDRISNGKSGYMPGFGKALGPEKIEALAQYIKKLPAEE